MIHGRTYQIGGRQSGTDGLAAARIDGKVAVGVGSNHGWQALRATSRVTSEKGHWVRTLDGRRASEMYANLFGYKPREWTYPPLIQLVRLYLFGLEQDGDSGQESAQYLVRSLLCVEEDGSLRMNRVIQEGSTAHLFIGSPENCLSSAKRATQLALDTLGSAKPILALIYADVAWQMLLEANPGSDAHVVRTVLGPDVPLVGGTPLDKLHTLSQQVSRNYKTNILR